MAFEKDLQTKKADALIAYKAAKNDFLQTVTRENIKGDFEKWKIFCFYSLGKNKKRSERDCMLLGVRI